MSWSTWFDTHNTTWLGQIYLHAFHHFPGFIGIQSWRPETDFCQALRDRQGKGRLVVILSNCWTQLWAEICCVEVAWPNIHKNKDFTNMLQLFFMEQTLLISFQSIVQWFFYNKPCLLIYILQHFITCYNYVSIKTRILKTSKQKNKNIEPFVGIPSQDGRLPMVGSFQKWLIFMVDESYHRKSQLFGMILAYGWWMANFLDPKSSPFFSHLNHHQSRLVQTCPDLSGLVDLSEFRVRIWCSASVRQWNFVFVLAMPLGTPKTHRIRKQKHNFYQTLVWCKQWNG